MGVSSTAAVDRIAGATRRASLKTFARLVLLATLAVSYVVGLSAVAWGLPVAVVADRAGDRVGWVAPGSNAWRLDIRPGLPMERWPPGVGDTGITVVVGDGLTVGVATRPPLPMIQAFGFALAFLALALLAWRAGLPGWSVLAGLSSAAAVGPLAPGLGYPPALFVGLMPPTATACAIVGSTPSFARPRYVAVGLVAVAAIFAAPVAATLDPDVAWPWDALWLAPSAAVLLLGLLSALPVVARTLGANGLAWRDRVSQLSAEAIPAVRHSRITTTANEQSRLAAELHDRVLPTIGQAMLELDAGDPAGRQRLTDVVDQLRNSIGVRQRLTLDRAGLGSAVAAYLAAQRLDAGISLKRRIDGRAPRLVEDAGYQVAQLAISNAIEHSSANEIQIYVSEHGDRLELEVADDGVGLDQVAVQTALSRGHLGLAAMRSAADDVAATLEIRSAPDEGTSVEFRWRR